MATLHEAVELLKEGTSIVLPENGIEEKLKLAVAEKRPLVVKLGFDPTSPDLHLGHAVALRKLKQFQDMGHQVVIIVGDFTAQIGDPTGKNKTRPPLSAAKVQENAATYLQQLGKILNLSQIQVRPNTEWLGQMSLTDVVGLLSEFTVQRLLSRDDFKQRFSTDTPIALHELVYPLLTGYDSLAIAADIEMGGTDQLFNMQIARSLQEARGQRPQAIICMPLLRGLDGTEKMSKSLGNYIGLTDLPRDMYGKAMSMPDSVLEEYIDLATSFEAKERESMKKHLKEGGNPMEIKKRVAFNLVEQYHAKASAEEAQDFFARQFQQKDPSQAEYEPVSLTALGLAGKPFTLVDLLVLANVSSSRSEARRLIEQGGVEVAGQKQADPAFSFDGTKHDLTVKAGKRRFLRLVP